MLENFVICVNAVIPSAIYLTMGILLKVFHVVTDEQVKAFTHMVFIALYPFIMFDNIYGKNFSDFMDAKLIIFSVAFTAFQIISAWILVCRIEPDNYNRGAMIQALFRSNIVLMGLPVGINIFGRGNVTAVAVVIMFVVPIYNAMIVVIFEHFRGGKASAAHMIRKILTNPIIIGGLVAMAFILLGIELPDIIYQTTQTLAECTTPIAMMLLGAALNVSEFSGDMKRLAICLTGKLAVYPALGIGLAILLGFRDVELIAVLLMLATPCALASYAMASSMGGNGRLAGESVVFSTIGSCITLPIWLFILKTAGMF